MLVLTYQAMWCCVAGAHNFNLQCHDNFKAFLLNGGDEYGKKHFQVKLQKAMGYHCNPAPRLMGLLKVLEKLTVLDKQLQHIFCDHSMPLSLMMEPEIGSEMLRI